MSQNTGTADRIVRLIVAAGAALAAALVGASSVAGIILLVVPGVLVVTATVGFCPLYRVSDITTCSLAPQRRPGQVSSR